MPTVSGVSAMTRYAASGGHVHTHAATSDQRQQAEERSDRVQGGRHADAERRRATARSSQRLDSVRAALRPRTA